MEHGQSVSLPVAIVNMDLLRFASANTYYKIESDNDDLIEMADQTLDLKGQFKRLTNKPSQHVLSSLDRHYVIPISLQRLAEQLSRYKIMVDGRAYSIDQVYRMLLALLLGEYLPERQLSTIIQSAHYAECYFPNSKAAVSLTLSRDDVNTQDQAALAIYSMDALMSNTICHALKQRLATLLA
ncbi:hypothetical protein BDF19DRAFT_176801 [Syncephalis fuscata]|nr:hypothetical protein BDF19DRAFT_176801 [Syncephalis fuscata]